MHTLALEPATVAGWIVWALAVTDDREPTTVLAWLFVILLVPVLGIVAYLFVGRDFRDRTASRSDRAEPQALAERGLEPVIADRPASEEVAR